MWVIKIIKTIAFVLVVSFLAVLLIFVWFKKLESKQLASLKDGDSRRAQKIEAIRSNKDNWQLYSNPDLGFSLMIPAETTVREASLVTAGSFGEDIDFDDNRKLIIDTVYGPESIQISTLDNITRVRRVPISENRTNIYPIENISNLQSYLSNKKITLDGFENTKLLKMTDYRYYYPGEKQLSFVISGGKSVEWFLNDSCCFPFIHIDSAEGKQIKLLQLDILKTVKFSK